MTRLARLARGAADAALQLTLPLFDSLPRIVNRPLPGRRIARLSDQYIDYELRRSRRRTIGFVVDDRGLTVTAPRWVTLGEIDDALVEKSGWIRRKLLEWRDYSTRRERLTIRWHDGATLPYLGRTLTMRADPRACGHTRLDGDELRIALTEFSVEQLRERAQAWLRARATELFEERISHFAAILGQNPTRWSLSSARTRWGSCGPDGAIRLNWRLMHFPPMIVDYVVAHELAHLRELNHSPRFWATVELLYPDYRQSRDWLRGYPDDITLE